MEKIASFTINHEVLDPGIYVSRKDVTPAGDCITTFDIRMTRPNREAALTPEALHAMEHLIATFLRNHPVWKEKVVYWGPMGCCTGNYLLMQGDLKSENIVDLIREAMTFVAEFEGEIPGATPRDCGNYSYMDLREAKAAAKKFLSEDLTNPILTYPV
ncbi:MAG: S-ribosylhomocysteine lyase [Clostridium sp.]|nr:S-ribosylhomocysteine lyase [Prevotella sp.]MCM1428816.1 S-ribosylhomocysteine lyase [Clostridium sp.]MCM1475191.1 S-ribosylhomocysteine lyase [Muribaculaceae bacterium]